MLDHDFKRQHLHEIAVFFPVGGADEIVQIVPAAALAALRLHRRRALLMRQLDHVVVVELLPQAANGFLLGLQRVPKRCQRLVEFFPRAIRHLFFALGSQLRDTVGQARFQLGPFREQLLFPLSQRVPHRFSEAGVPVFRFVGEAGL